MAYKSMNLDLLGKFNEAAKRVGINWRLERRQAGMMLWSQAFVRNGTGDEANAHAQLNIDDEANIAYVCIVVNGAEKYQYLRDKLEANPGIKMLADNEMPGKPNPHIVQYKLDEKFKFVSNGDIVKWIEEIFNHMSDVLKAVANIVY